MAFTAPFAVAAMSDPGGAGVARRALGGDRRRAPPEGYYADSIRLQSMLVVSGNWWCREGGAVRALRGSGDRNGGSEGRTDCRGAHACARPAAGSTIEPDVTDISAVATHWRVDESSERQSEHLTYEHSDIS